MDTSSNQPPMKVMIILWKWDAGKNEIQDIDEQKHDRWFSTDNRYVICRLDMLKNNAMEYIVSLAGRHVDKGDEVLIFLHKSFRHNFDEKDVALLKKRLNIYNLKIRIRLFGGGIEPIYYTEHSPNGILGSEGDFADETYFGDDLIESTLFVNGIGVNNLNPINLEYIWNFYWFEARIVFNLAEDIQIQVLSKDTVESKSFLIQHNGSGNHILMRMAYFSNNPEMLEKFNDKVRYVQDHDMGPYINFIKLNFRASISTLEKDLTEMERPDSRSSKEDIESIKNKMSGLTNDHNKLLGKFDLCRSQVSKVLGQDGSIEWSTVYDSLKDLYLSLPEDTI